MTCGARPRHEASTAQEVGPCLPSLPNIALSRAGPLSLAIPCQSLLACWPIGSNCGARADEALGRHDRKGLNEDIVQGLDQRDEATRPADLREGAKGREALHEAEADLEGSGNLQRNPGQMVAGRPTTRWSRGHGSAMDRGREADTCRCVDGGSRASARATVGKQSPSSSCEASAEAEAVRR